ncbi:copper chaperone PCu(A)C [Mycobacterium sp. 236(2023)]|uniref:copper chaperone PCu(A)C n=1 Tax=Mycobacterium sp. 236(2023) TaxID=3038163 RepID=UPI0024150463|nr:copper chaperone PCu(A)C [Mycobacterium sp. 236(2023)]MDG4664772.1 copper chaperone PCu(A)C [Mycobacterium sp. 236(2023)]
MSDKKIGALVIALAAALLPGCSTPEPTEPVTMASSTTFDSPWASAADSGMTAVFGTLTNTGDHDVQIVGAESPAAERGEVHEIAPGAGGTNTMRPKEGGVTIPPGGTHELTPGGDHLMLMDLTEPLRPGADVEVTVAFEDGSTMSVTAQVRDFAGGNEEYSPSAHGHG